ncbi:hypothetical protein ACP4OV_005591 [Aristida adscensionis]
MSSDNDSSQSSGEEGSAESSTQTKKRGVRKPSKWPTDKIVVTEINEDGTPTDIRALKRMRKLAGLVARQRIPLKVDTITEISKDERQEIFDRYVMRKLEFQPEMKKAATKMFWLIVASTRRDFKTKLTTKFAAVQKLQVLG